MRDPFRTARDGLLPAGIPRRTFLRRSVAAAGAAAAAKGVSLAGVLAPAGSARAAGGPKTLVLLRQHGGNDGLNSVIPYTNGTYHDLRPTLAVPEAEAAPHAVADGLAFHPKMAALLPHFRAGRLAVIHSVGYAPYTLSHFRSEIIWQTGDVDAREPTGWIGRWLDTLAPAGSPDVLGVNVAWSSDLVFGARHANAFVVPSLENVDFPTDWRAWDDVARKRDLFERLSLEPRTPGSPADVMATAGYVLSRNTALYASVPDAVTTEFPDSDLGRALRSAARMIAARRAGDLAVGVIQVGVDGFDTHADQDVAGGHPDLWEDIATSVDAFHAELTAQGAADDVLVLMYSEFGRRPEENASKGTDHGTNGQVFAFGNPVVGGLYGPPDDLSDLDGDGNLKFAIDFRQVYATVLARFLGADPEEVLGADPAQVPFLP